MIVFVTVCVLTHVHFANVITKRSNASEHWRGKQAFRLFGYFTVPFVDSRLTAVSVMLRMCIVEGVRHRGK